MKSPGGAALNLMSLLNGALIAVPEALDAIVSPFSLRPKLAQDLIAAPRHLRGVLDA
jgi:hypothetical protein